MCWVTPGFWVAGQGNREGAVCKGRRAGGAGSSSGPGAVGQRGCGLQLLLALPIGSAT